MIMDLIEKLPGPAIGMLVAGGVWFGFNYAVLAERAMARDARENAIPACMAALDAHQETRRLPNLDLGAVTGLPLIGEMLDAGMKLAQPRLMSRAEREAKCACASAAQHRAGRFDYALHTASFRLVDPDAAAGLRTATIEYAISGACGAIPMGGSR